VQELSKMNDEKDAVILQQQKQIDAIMTRLEALEKKNGIADASNTKAEGLRLWHRIRLTRLTQPRL